MELFVNKLLTRNKKNKLTLYNVMRTIAIQICERLNDIRLLFGGVYELNKDSELKEFEISFYDIDVPNSKVDRLNLRKDRIIVLRDYKKCVNEKSESLIEKDRN